MANNERNIKKIDQRDWQSIKNKWLAYIPTITNPGDPPPMEVKKFYGLQEIYQKTIDNKNIPHFEEVASLRSSVLWEGLYLCHKAIHVNGCAIVQLDNGTNTWALANAYQSSFFAVKGILSLLGLSFPRLSKSFMIDCFPKEEELSNSQRKKGRIPKTELKFLIFNDLSHVEYWEILQRILFVSTIDCWEEEIVDYLETMRAEKFVEERNKLHYVNNYWTFPKDLYNRNIVDAFGQNEEFTTDYKQFITTISQQHPIFLNYTLIKMLLKLTKELANLSNIVNDEYELMIKTLHNGMHSRFLNSFNISTL